MKRPAAVPTVSREVRQKTNTGNSRKTMPKAGDQPDEALGPLMFGNATEASEPTPSQPKLWDYIKAQKANPRTPQKTQKKKGGGGGAGSSSSSSKASQLKEAPARQSG